MTKLLSFHCKYIHLHCPIKVCIVFYYFMFIILLDACLLSKREKERVRKGGEGQMGHEEP